MLLLASIAHAKLLYGDLEGTRLDMDAALKILDTLENVESGVNAAYYGVAADYYKVHFFFSFFFGFWVCFRIWFFLGLLGFLVILAWIWMLRLTVFIFFCDCRPRRSMLRIIGIRCSTLRVLMLRRICPPKNVSCGRMISVFRRSWGIRFITLVNW